MKELEAKLAEKPPSKEKRGPGPTTGASQRNPPGNRSTPPSALKNPTENTTTSATVTSEGGPRLGGKKVKRMVRFQRKRGATDVEPDTEDALSEQRSRNRKRKRNKNSKKKKHDTNTEEH